MGTCIILESAAQGMRSHGCNECCVNPNAVMTTIRSRGLTPSLLSKGGSDFKISSFSHLGQSFHSRVLENCEDVADFDEVGRLVGGSHALAQRGTSTFLPPGSELAPNPRRQASSGLLISGLLPGREPPAPLHPDPSQGPLHRRAPCRATGTVAVQA